MIKAYTCAALSDALVKLGQIITENEKNGLQTVVFCEDRLSLAAERAVCSAVEGTFLTGVYSFSRFLSSERGKTENVLSAQGSAMAIRRIIERNKDKLTLFKKLSATAAAQTVYDTIALLYSSRVSADDLKNVSADGLLKSKLSDLALIYSEYAEYLETAGKRDRNEYLRDLPEIIEKSFKIRGNCVIFFGFQSFTCSTTECARACFSVARDVAGLFIGGAEDVYVNEALPAFMSAAATFGGAEAETVKSGLIPEADRLRKAIFNPESFFAADKLPTSKIHVFAASDREEELEFIAASIKRYVADGERYAKISVMLPDVAGTEGALARIFSEYRIPYYADRRIPLSEHPLCDFLISYLSCATAGCRPRDVDAVVASPYFPAEREDKDIFRNYCLRLANFRGGVRREPNAEILQNLGFDINAVERVRATFLDGLKNLPAKGDGAAVCRGLREILSLFGADKILSRLSEKFSDSFPAEAALCDRVYESVLSVLSEAQSLAPETSAHEMTKILKSGFSSLEISLIPPKADAVFVGDIAACANTGSNVVFAAQLTSDVPSTSSDTALLTDREIDVLCRSDLDISPKIRQVNMRRRELTGLNVCAFRNKLYLSWPARLSGEECRPSEIINYVCAAFTTPSGAPIAPLDYKRVERSGKALKYYCSEKLPALRRLAKDPSDGAAGAVYEVLKAHGFGAEAIAAISAPGVRKISCARPLFMQYSSVTPTALETYFTCPYLNFMRQGLKVQERDEGAVRPLDSGNFIHTVLQRLIGNLNGARDEQEIAALARERAEELLKCPPFSSLADSKSGQYAANGLVDEAVKVCVGAFVQIRNSRFEVTGAEQKCEISLGDGVKLYGRVDRIDQSGDMVRIIDYKTGTVDSSPVKYYMGLKLQLPLYLLAAAEGKRAVGAYYFPASVEYKDKADGVFRLQGYMDGSDEVVSTSDINVLPTRKSEYFDAYLGGRKVDSAMDAESFAAFINYSRMVAKRGADELLSGEISPSPASEACKFCKMGGSCGFDSSVDEERSVTGVKCADIAEISKENGGGV